MKTKIIRDRKYLDWLREQPCAVSGQDPPCDGAHTFKGTGGGGIGLKSSDAYALPLSPAEHRKQSGMSEIAYWREVLVNRPLLRGDMVASYVDIHRIVPDWLLGDIRTDDVLVKRLVQAFAENRYYNKFMKGKTP